MKQDNPARRVRTASSGRNRVPPTVVRRGVPSWVVVVIAMGAAAGGYAYGAQSTGLGASLQATGPASLDRLDCMAQLHAQRRKERAQAGPPPAPAAASAYRFHNALAGSTVKPPAPESHPPPKPAPKVAAKIKHAAPKPVAPAAVPPPVLPTDVAAQTVASATAATAVEPPQADGQLRAAPAVGQFTLQVGAFPQKTDALALFDRMRTQGLRPAIAPVSHGESTWFRVRVGRFVDRTAAELGQHALLATADVQAVITPH